MNLFYVKWGGWGCRRQPRLDGPLEESRRLLRYPIRASLNRSFQRQRNPQRNRRNRRQKNEQTNNRSQIRRQSAKERMSHAHRGAQGEAKSCIWVLQIRLHSESPCLGGIVGNYSAADLPIAKRIGAANVTGPQL